MGLAQGLAELLCSLMELESPGFLLWARLPRNKPCWSGQGQALAPSPVQEPGESLEACHILQWAEECWTLLHTFKALLSEEMLITLAAQQA